ncbi:MAG: ABC transporter ATP-binding protein [Candidatus Hodarchaeota archaeon]
MKNNENILIQFRGLTKRFGKFYAVSNINLEIKRGEIVGFLGPNGAGKTTTMKMMAYLLKPTDGEIWIRNNGKLERLTLKNRDYLLDNIGFLIEIPAFYGDMTPRQILSYFANLKGYPRKKVKDRVAEVVEMFGLSEWLNKKIKTFSKGMRQKIGICSAIVHDPDIVVLDEPQTGLDPKARKDVRDFILKLKQMGKTIFLSSHLLYEISEVADRIAIINQGKLIAFDTLDNLELMARKSVINFELYDTSKYNLVDLLERLNKIILPLTGIEGDNTIKVTFSENSKIFEVPFNGVPKNQLKIHNALFKNNFNVLEFSVPKANLLEKLFIDLTGDSYEAYGNEIITKGKKKFRR